MNPSSPGVTVEIDLNGILVPITFNDDALTTIADAVAAKAEPEPPSPYMTIIEAAEYLRCTRQRVDDLLSARRLKRVKDGTRTLIRRSDLDAYLASNPRRPR